MRTRLFAPLLFVSLVRSRFAGEPFVSGSSTTLHSCAREGSLLRLVCPSAYGIAVVSALFGSPTSRELKHIHAYDGHKRHCTMWKPAHGFHDASVDLAAQQLASRVCDGKAVCEIDVSDAARHLRDPCPGLVKVLRIAIKCRSAARGPAFGRKEGTAAALIDEAEVSQSSNHVSDREINSPISMPSPEFPRPPPNPWADKLDTLLKFWHRAAEEGGVAYSITYGTYLGWVRNRDYIPYDHDVDVHIGSEGVPSLMALANRTWCCTPQELSQQPIRFGEPRLLLNPNHRLHQIDSERSRFSCEGKPVRWQMDACSFTGPVARLVYRSGGPRHYQTMFLDVFVFHRDQDRPRVSRLRRTGWLDELHGEYATYAASQYGTALPRVGTCTLHGVRTKCFGRAEGKEFLRQYYGPSYLMPDKQWDPRTSKWVKVKASQTPK